MQQVGRSDLVPTKGYHFPDGGAYVGESPCQCPIYNAKRWLLSPAGEPFFLHHLEYDGEVEADARASLAEALGRKCQELIDADLPVNVDIAEDADGGSTSLLGTLSKLFDPLTQTRFFLSRFSSSPYCQHGRRQLSLWRHPCDQNWPDKGESRVQLSSTLLPLSLETTLTSFLFTGNCR